MTQDEDKTLERLVKAVELAYASPGKVFWRAFLSGLGRGIGSLFGWLLLLGLLFYLFQISGLATTFRELQGTLGKLSNSVNSLPFPK